MEGDIRQHGYGTLAKPDNQVFDDGFNIEKDYSADRITAHSRVKTFGSARMVAIIIGILMSFAIALSTYMITPPLSAAFESLRGSDYLVESKNLSALCVPSINFSDAYTRKLGPYFRNYSFMNDVSGFVAAYQSTRFAVEDACGGNRLFEWLIDGVETVGGPSSEVNHTFVTLGRHSIKATASLNTIATGAVYSSEAIVVCRYVRREVRTLDDFDRIKFVDAVKTVYIVHQNAGKMLYGSEYKDASYFMEYHTWMAGSRDCDHLHDGMGFLLGHNAITMEFENNLQLIDPSVTIPYWDYSIDMHVVSEYDKDFSLFYKSPIISDDWFGPMGSSDHEFQVVQGNFANIPLSATAWNITARVTNAWGRIRSPWNTAPQPYLIRSNKTYGYMSSYSSAPRCSIFYEAMNYSDILTFTKFAQANAHGAIHTFLGGVSNANWKKWIDEIDWFQGEGVALQGFGIVKNMWRKGYMDCPSECSIDTNLSTCACSCPRFESWDEERALTILSDVIGSFDANTWYLNNTVIIARQVLALVCGRLKEYSHPWLGDAMNSGATADPSFWVTHPNVDRLFQHRRMIGFTGLDVWPYGNETDPKFYWGAGKNSKSCWGHQPSDTMIWKDLFLEDSGRISKYYSLYELFEKMDAHVGKNPYVYDYFQWDHCTSEGIPADLRWIGPIGDDDYWVSWSR